MRNEYDNLRSQFATSNLGGRRYLPLNFHKDAICDLEEGREYQIFAIRFLIQTLGGLRRLFLPKTLPRERNGID